MNGGNEYFEIFINFVGRHHHRLIKMIITLLRKCQPQFLGLISGQPLAVYKDSGVQAYFFTLVDHRTVAALEHAAHVCADNFEPLRSDFTFQILLFKGNTKLGIDLLEIGKAPALAHLIHVLDILLVMGVDMTIYGLYPGLGSFVVLVGSRTMRVGCTQKGRPFGLVHVGHRQITLRIIVKPIAVWVDEELLNAPDGHGDMLAYVAVVRHLVHSRAAGLVQTTQGLPHGVAIGVANMEFLERVRIGVLNDHLLTRIAIMPTVTVVQGCDLAERPDEQLIAQPKVHKTAHCFGAHEAGYMQIACQLSGNVGRTLAQFTRKAKCRNGKICAKLWIGGSNHGCNLCAQQLPRVRGNSSNGLVNDVAHTNSIPAFQEVLWADTCPRWTCRLAAAIRPLNNGCVRLGRERNSG